MTSTLILLILLAQSNAGVRPPAETDTTVLARGWAALAADRADAAAADADRVLARRPWDHAAVLLKVSARASAKPADALDTYEAWLGANPEDGGLLEPIALAIARSMAAGSNPGLRREARRILAAARTAVPAPSAADEGPFDADARRARDGDAAALERLAAEATDPAVRDKSPLVHTLEGVGAAAVPALLSIVESAQGPAPGEAAAALGRLGTAQAVPALQRAMQAADPFVRFSATVALARLNDPAGLQGAAAMLASDVPDIKLMAAEAWNGQNGPWVDAVMPLLDNRDGLIRLNAARLLAPLYPDAARKVLIQASDDPNPVVRSEALKESADLTAAGPAMADLASLRRRLRDDDPTVRLYAASGVLAAVRGGR